MLELELIPSKNGNIIIWQLKTHNQKPNIFTVLKTKPNHKNYVFLSLTYVSDSAWPLRCS
jgi:hypothetical protein